MSELNRSDIAKHYFVSDLSGADIPATRLSNILDTLKRGRPLSVLALTYLREQGLFALWQLALGESTYEAFCMTADSEQRKRKQAAEE